MSKKAAKTSKEFCAAREKPDNLGAISERWNDHVFWATRGKEKISRKKHVA